MAKWLAGLWFLLFEFCSSGPIEPTLEISSPEVVTPLGFAFDRIGIILQAVFATIASAKDIPFNAVWEYIMASAAAFGANVEGLREEY